MKPLFLLPLFAAAALAQQPLDLPRNAYCDSKTSTADIACMDFGAISGQLPERQMQIWVKPKPNVRVFLLTYRLCDASGQVVKQHQDSAVSVPLGETYASYFVIKPTPSQFVCFVEVEGLP
jgi:hypothetical protein